MFNIFKNGSLIGTITVVAGMITQITGRVPSKYQYTDIKWASKHMQNSGLTIEHS